MQVGTKKRVGILRGGTGENYSSSLIEGGDIISHITQNLAEKYKTVDILIDRDGVWHLNGLPIVPAEVAHKVDVVWNVAHPESRTIVQNFSIPQVSSGHFYSALANNRDILREHIKKIGIHMPRHIISPKSAREVFEKF